MWASILGAAAGLGSSIWGGIQASKNAKKAEGILQQERQKNDDWYGRRYYQDYVQTAEAQHLLNQTNQLAQDYVAQAAGRSRVGGGSAEEVAAAMEKGSNLMANTAGNIASQATQYKNQIDAQHRSADQAIDNAYYGLYNQRAQANTEAANQGMQAGMGLIGADMQANLKYGKGLFGDMVGKKKDALEIATA